MSQTAEIERLSSTRIDIGALAIRAGTSARARRAGLAVGLGASVAVGAALRLWHLGANRLSYDESFTAMAGRLPFGSLMSHLRVDDSHPPLDYLLRAPIVRAGLSDAFVRLPSALCSIAALALFAWWMRRWGRAGVFATAAMALAAFQISHGREARMYAELQLLGVGTAIVVDAWLRRARRWHAPVVGALTALALLTNVSGILLGAGLLLVAGRRNDREAWRWRAAVGIGGAVWAALWGRSFLVQTHGGHSSWIPRTTVGRAVSVVSSLVTSRSDLALLVVAAIITGGVLLRRRDRVMARTWTCLCVVPVAFAIVLGLFAPVLLDRTLTLFSWGAPFAVAVVLDAVTPRRVAAGALALAAILAVLVPGAWNAVDATNGPTTALNHLASVARPGDIVAIRPFGKRVELEWSLGVRSRHGPTQPVRVDLPRTPALQLTAAPRSGRVWLLDFHGAAHRVPVVQRCAPDWVHGSYRIECLRLGSRPATGI